MENVQGRLPPVIQPAAVPRSNRSRPSHATTDLLDDIRSLEAYVKAELNVKAVRYERDESKFIQLYAKRDLPVLGKCLGKRMKEFQPPSVR